MGLATSVTAAGFGETFVRFFSYGKYLVDWSICCGCVMFEIDMPPLLWKM
jgi:hypothetical protein